MRKHEAAPLLLGLAANRMSIFDCGYIALVIEGINTAGGYLLYHERIFSGLVIIRCTVGVDPENILV